MDTLAPQRMQKAHVHQAAELLFHLRPSETYVRLVRELTMALPAADEHGFCVVVPELAALLRPVEAHLRDWSSAASSSSGSGSGARARDAVVPVEYIDGRAREDRTDARGGGRARGRGWVGRTSSSASNHRVDESLAALHHARYTRPSWALTDEEWFFLRCGSYLDGLAWWKAVDALDQDRGGGANAHRRYRQAFDMVYTSGWSEQNQRDKYRQLFDDGGRGFLNWKRDVGR